MRRFPAALLLLAMGFVVTHGSATGRARQERALWIWEEASFGMLDDPEVREQSLAFMKHQGITTAYLYADSFKGRNPLLDEPEKYRKLIGALHDENIRVHALLGSAYLRTQEYVLPEKRRTALRMVALVLEYNSSTDERGRFDGINLDIEPYLLKGWKQRTEEFATLYLDMGRAMMTLVHERDENLPVGAVIPFWYDRVGRIEWNNAVKPMNEHVQDLFDYVSIMDYRDKAEGRDGIIAHAATELDYADKIGKHVIVGVETKRSQPEKVTFYEEGVGHMERELKKAEAAFKGRKSFLGFAIHHYTSLKSLTAKDEPPAPDQVR